MLPFVPLSINRTISKPSCPLSQQIADTLHFPMSQLIMSCLLVTWAGVTWLVSHGVIMLSYYHNTHNTATWPALINNCSKLSPWIIRHNTKLTNYKPINKLLTSFKSCSHSIALWKLIFWTLLMLILFLLNLPSSLTNPTDNLSWINLLDLTVCPGLLYRV